MSKPIIEVTSPAGECSCSFATWMTKVWDILNKYRDRIDIVSLMSDSSRAKELGVGNRAIVINGEKIALFELERKLNELLK
ncbi:MAG: hypothetical protein ACFFB2_02215 [Promethearchaeota archaeon]